MQFATVASVDYWH